MRRDNPPRDQDAPAPSVKAVRALRALSQCCKVLVRAQDERDLLVRVCEICTEVAGYRLAWVGLAEQDEARTIRPVAQAGFEQGYLETVDVTWADSDRGRGPVGTAVRAGAPCVIRDTAADPRFAPWRDEAMRRGYASCVALPLAADGTALGAIAIYAPEKDAFDDEELALLRELADGLAYGMAALRARAARDVAEAVLRRSYGEMERRVEERTRELAASEARYRALVESSQDAIFQLDPNMRLLFVNAAGARSLGTEPSALVGRTLAEVFPQDAAGQLAPVVQEVFVSGMPSTTERTLHAPGGIVEYSTVLAPVFGAEGRAESVVGIARDVTQRKRAELALRESEERFRLAFEETPVGMIIGVGDGTVADANQALCRMLGYTKEELCGRHVRDLTHPEDRDLSAPLVRRLSAGEIPSFTIEKRYIKKSGEILWARATTAAARDARGRMLFALGVVEDITARKRAEEALCQSEARHRRLLENLPNLVLVVDSDSIIQYVNRPVPGAAVEQLIGSIGFGHMVPEYQERCRDALRRALSTGQVQSLEVLDRYGLWWSCQVVSLAELEGRPLAIVICSDVTERHRAKEALLREQQGLRQLLDVYERHRRLIAYEIHDGVAQPLTGALMTLEGTVVRLQAECAAATRDGFARVAQLLREGIAQARRLMGGLGPPVLDESGLPAAVEYLVYEARKDWGMDVDCSVEAGLDRLAKPLETAVFRIVQEALANAGRHSRSPTIRVALVQRDDRIRIEVEDRGVGFDPEAVDPGRFGLQGIRQRARLLGGLATIDSAPGRGARVSVELPLVKADVAATGGSAVEY